MSVSGSAAGDWGDVQLSTAGNMVQLKSKPLMVATFNLLIFTELRTTHVIHVAEHLVKKVDCIIPAFDLLLYV